MEAVVVFNTDGCLYRQKSEKSDRNMSSAIHKL